MRIKHEDVERGSVAAGGERRGAGVARGRPDDRHMLAAARQHGIEQMPDQLQRQILESEGRAVEQLQQPQPLVQLDQRGHRGVAEGAISGLSHLTQFRGRERLASEQAHDMRRKLRIRQPSKPVQCRRVQYRQGFRHEEAAILGETGEQHVLEGIGDRRRSRIAGTEVFHPVKV